MYSGSGSTVSAHVVGTVATSTQLLRLVHHSGAPLKWTLWDLDFVVSPQYEWYTLYWEGWACMSIYGMWRCASIRGWFVHVYMGMCLGPCTFVWIIALFPFQRVWYKRFHCTSPTYVHVHVHVLYHRNTCTCSLLVVSVNSAATTYSIVIWPGVGGVQ